MEQIKHITLRYTDTITNIDIPDGKTATKISLRQYQKITLNGDIEAILGRPVTVIIIAPEDIDTSKIIEGIDNVLNPVKLSVTDLKFYSFEEGYAKYRQNKLRQE